MGTWGVHSFDNDDAKEWAAAYREMGLAVAKSTIDVALGDLRNGGLPADLASRAIAAAEAVAYALGRGSPAGIEAFAGAPVADVGAAQDLIENADAAVTAISEASELKVLWTEANQFEDWLAVMEDLQQRLIGDAINNVQDVREAPVGTAPPAAETSQNDDVLAAISKLSADVQLLRQETAENILRLAELIEARDQ